MNKIIIKYAYSTFVYKSWKFNKNTKQNLIVRVRKIRNVKNAEHYILNGIQIKVKIFGN